MRFRLLFCLAFAVCVETARANGTNANVSGATFVSPQGINLAGTVAAIFREQTSCYSVQVPIGYSKGDVYFMDTNIVQVWLLKKDGTAVAQTGKPSWISLSTSSPFSEDYEFYTFQKAAADEIAGVTVSYNGKLYCHELMMAGDVPLPVAYSNATYDLTFALPMDWKGYSVLVQQWNGQAYSPALDHIITTEHGPIIVLRNPAWKAGTPWQDIPIMIFTRKQWDEIHTGKYNAAGAGGIIYELWHNEKYVFGIHSRYNWYELKGWQETDKIIQQNCAAYKEPHLYPE